MYYLIAYLVGGLIVVQMTINSILASRIGNFNGIIINYTTGLIVTFFMICFFNVKFDFETLKEIPSYVYLGGCLGVLVILSCNYLIPKLSIVHATLTLIAGQLITGNLIDFILFGTLPFKRIIGCMFILAGVFWGEKKQS